MRPYVVNQTGELNEFDAKKCVRVARKNYVLVEGDYSKRDSNELRAAYGPDTEKYRFC